MATTQLKHSRIVAASPIYYGWIIFIIATIGQIATLPGQSVTFSLFFDFFIEDFGLSRTAVSSLYGLGTFIASLGLTYVGTLIDHHGNRKVMVAIAGLFALSLIGMSTVSGPIPLMIGFIALRGLGQGSLGLASTTVIAEWFKRLRGRVMSFLLVGFALSQAAYTPILQRILETEDWRTVWVILGVVVGVVMVPLAWGLMRDRPEEYGLQPDGAHDSAEQQAATDAADLAASYSLREAMRTGIFWIFLSARILSPAWGTGLILHQISIFEGLGFSARTAASTYAQITILTALASLIMGVIVDRLRPGWVMTIQLIGLSLSLAMATMMTSPPLLVLYGIGFAIMMGGGGVFDGAVWANLFGRAHQGSIRGFVTTTGVIGTAIGPVIFGLSFDVLGNYDAALWMGVALALLAIPAALIAKPPIKRKRKSA